MRVHWPLEDPAAFQGSYEETLEEFREIRDQIDLTVLALSASPKMATPGLDTFLPN